MNTCIVCGKSFEPKPYYKKRKTCSDECLHKLYVNLQKTNLNGKRHQFEKGHIPHNKGVSTKEWLTEEQREKCARTQIQNQTASISKYSKIENRFLPHNTKAKGTVTKRIVHHYKGKNKGKIDYVYYINIDWKGNRKPNNLYKKYLWEVANQKDIPDGYVLYCIDGNPNNITLENLELISRAELAIRNKSGR